MASFFPATTAPSGISPTWPNSALSLSALGRGLVALTISLSGIVLSEPAPSDLLTMMLMGALPLAGLIKVQRTLMALSAAWLVIAAAAVLATLTAPELVKSGTHAGVSLYMYLSTFLFAAFVLREPERHATLIFRAYVVAATGAAIAGIAGYFNLVPGAYEMLTKFGRASGTFKDPNVLGAFLVPAIVFCLHRLLSGPIKTTWDAAFCLPALSLALLLSFSRGAWISLSLALAIYGYVMMVTTRSNRLRLRMTAVLLIALLAASLGLALALQIPQIGELLSERATLSQSYDLGPEGRYGGHAKALRLLLENPFGIGALTFSDRYHHEDVHNVYLNMFMNAGWLGGLGYMLIVGLTMLIGARALLRPGPTHALLVVAFASLAGNVFEGQIIDTDHWRHMYLMMALTWGLMLAAPVSHLKHGSVRLSRPIRANRG